MQVGEVAIVESVGRGWIKVCHGRRVTTLRAGLLQGGAVCCVEPRVGVVGAVEVVEAVGERKALGSPEGVCACASVRTKKCVSKVQE